MMRVDRVEVVAAVGAQELTSRRRCPAAIRRCRARRRRRTRRPAPPSMSSAIERLVAQLGVGGVMRDVEDRALRSARRPRHAALRRRAGRRARRCPARSRRRRSRRASSDTRRAARRPQDAVVRHARRARADCSASRDALLQLVAADRGRASASAPATVSCVNEKTRARLQFARPARAACTRASRPSRS